MPLLKHTLINNDYSHGLNVTPRCSFAWLYPWMWFLSAKKVYFYWYLDASILLKTKMGMTSHPSSDIKVPSYLDCSISCGYTTEFPATFYQEILLHAFYSCFRLLTSFTEMLISFSSRTWHLPIVPKLLPNGLLTILLLCWPTAHLTWTPQRINEWLSKRTHPKNTETLKAVFKATRPSITLLQNHALMQSTPHCSGNLRY